MEVTFTPAGSGTSVTFHHRGFAGLRADHPVRHGLEGGAFTHMFGMWWGDLITALRERIAAL